MARPHTVAAGDCMASIAKRCQFVDYRTIWDHSRNASLRRTRPNPNQLRPGDRVYIPDPQQGNESRGTGQVHTFEVNRYEVRLRIVVRNRARQPYVSKRYEVAISGEATRTGTTDGRGLLEVLIPADAQAADLRLWLEDETLGPGPFECRLRIGHLDPIEADEGVQARLNNLGFPCGEVDGVVGSRTRAALTAFQTDQTTEATGRLDSDTRERLRQQHDTLQGG